MQPARGTDTFGFESTLGKIARVLTGQYGTAVAFSPEGPRVERDRIVIPSYDIFDERDRDTLVGYLDLLVARSKYSSNDALAALGNGTDGRLAQAIEDQRVCRRLLDNYPGARWFIGQLRQRAAQDARNRWQKLSWRDKLVWLVERRLWLESPEPSELSPSLSAALHAVDETIAAARSSRSTDESIAAARAVIATVRALSSSGGAHNMMLTAGDADGYDAESVPATFDGPPSHGDGTAAPDNASDASITQAASSNVIDGAGMGHSPLGTPAESVASAVASGGSQPGGQSRPLLSVPLTTEFDLVTDRTGRGDARNWHALRSLARAETSPLKAKLERALKADELTHWKREQERGEIDRTALARLAIAPGYRTPFRVKRVTKGRDAAVTLLIDRSGSMAGRKIELARLCVAALCDALTQLGFDSEVLGYSSIESAEMRLLYERQRASGVDLSAYNRTVERLDLQIYKRFGAADLSGLADIECGHENPDGEALAWAAGRLADHRADRKILMVLSDGDPATGDGNPAILRSDLHARIDAIGRTGIEIVGVGILDDAVETFYPRSIVVRKLHELPGTAFGVLSAMLLDR
ncbi:cobalamin biosynthesis protein CobT [Paraburkholderia acidicola]|uniref:Cobalamin biosynthesis protein CobT n=1 Tax=Paraburkholderia acidicola TaxID=1912599 RepID=A0A2A4EQT7_9BURK|nr:VWA domain-containing protein [Paraburkholderia acidicola]PCE23205.1 cobalamin biosynthesis protein CobT [Paraburkholderia acidicola]